MMEKITKLNATSPFIKTILGLLVKIRHLIKGKEMKRTVEVVLLWTWSTDRERVFCAGFKFLKVKKERHQITFIGPGNETTPRKTRLINRKIPSQCNGSCVHGQFQLPYQYQALPHALEGRGRPKVPREP